MSKRRTRKEKKEAHHHFTLSWEDLSKAELPEAHVKRQFKLSSKPDSDTTVSHESANISAKGEYSASIKHNIIRSLIIVSFILALELVIYLVWNVK